MWWQSSIDNFMYIVLWLSFLTLLLHYLITPKCLVSGYYLAVGEFERTWYEQKKQLNTQQKHTHDKITITQLWADTMKDKTHSLILILVFPYMTVSQTSQKVLMTTRYCQGRTIYFIRKVNGKIVINFSFNTILFFELCDIFCRCNDIRLEHLIVD
jgi:hypothetical protein